MSILAMSVERNKRLEKIAKLMKRDWIPDVIENAIVEADTFVAWSENLATDLELELSIKTL